MLGYHHLPRSGRHPPTRLTPLGIRHPLGPGRPPWDQTHPNPPPGTRQTPQDKTHPTPPGPGRHPLNQADTPPGRPARIRHTHPPGPGRSHPRSDTTHPPCPWEADSSIQSTSGRYASYWNAFLFSITTTPCFMTKQRSGTFRVK